MRQLKISERYTPRNDTISRYLSELEGKVPLSSEKEYEVATAAAEGDPAAVEKLVTANLRFVVSVAKQYGSSPELVSGLIAQGNIGLIDAAKTFDPTRGFKFISYAVWHIRKEILKYLSENGKVIKIPTNVTQSLNRIRRIESSLMNSLDREPTLEEILVELENMGHPTTVEKLANIMLHRNGAVPLDSSGSEDLLSPIEKIDSGEDTAVSINSSDVTKTYTMLLGSLKGYEVDILLRRHGIKASYPESFTTISESYGRSPEWARNVYKKAIKKASIKARRSNLTSADFEI